MKKIKTVISIILCLSLLAAFSAYFAAGAANSYSLGDLDGDSSITSNDALIVLKYAVDDSTVALSTTQLAAGDVDASGEVNSTDAMYILQFVTGYITQFPAGSTGEKISIGGGFYYDPVTGKITNENGSGLLGFSYDTVDRCFYSTNEAWQRNFGFTYLYDDFAPLAFCILDTTRIFFNYGGNEWMLQLWKGQYGATFLGAEIGLYYRDENSTDMIDKDGNKFYKCAEDEQLLTMKCALYYNDVLQFSRRDQLAWWMTGFSFGTLNSFGLDEAETAKLKIDATLTLPNEDMLNAMVGGFRRTTSIQHNSTNTLRRFSFTKAVSEDKLADGKYYVDGLKLRFIWQGPVS